MTTLKITVMMMMTKGGLVGLVGSQFIHSTCTRRACCTSMAVLHHKYNDEYDDDDDDDYDDDDGDNDEYDDYADCDKAGPAALQWASCILDPDHMRAE